MYRLWRDETMYQIWTQSSNPRRSYCDFNIRPNDLYERHVTCWARLWAIFHQFLPSTTYPCLNDSVSDADTLCRAVTLTFDLLTLNFYNTSAVMRVNCKKIWPKSNNPRLSDWRFSTFSPCNFRGWAQLTELSQGCVDPTSPNFAKA